MSSKVIPERLYKQIVYETLPIEPSFRFHKHFLPEMQASCAAALGDQQIPNTNPS